MNNERFGRRDLFKRAAAGAGMGLLGTSIGGAALAQEPAVPMSDKVPTRVLGSTGEKIPILLMGGGQAFDPVYDRLLHRAFKDGLTYIDTADNYANGRSHEGLGAFIEQVGRKNVWITSKSGLHGSGGALLPPEVFRKEIEAAMPALRTDYLDMYFMHGIQDPRNLDPEYIQMGQDMKKRGFTRFFGFSCHDGTVVELLNKAAKIGSAGIDAIMFRYNFTLYGDLELNKAMDACIKAGIGLIGMKTQTSVPEDNQFVKKFQSQNFNLFQARLKAAWADERITACVSEITNTRILKENADAAKSEIQLSMRELMQLNEYARATAHHRCQGCNHICESRVDGDLRIADTLRYLMYDECYGKHEEARRLYHALRPEQRDFRGLDLAAATAACPQGIPIARRLEQARLRLA